MRNERLDEIMEILRAAHFVTVAQLADRLYTSPSSIRRDLVALENQKLVMRVRGGVKLCEFGKRDFSFAYRLKTNVDKKRMIAAKAVALVSPGDVVFVDSSTTGLYLVYELAKISGITVVTNGIYAAQYLSDYDVDVICTGGRLDLVERVSMIGPETWRTLQNIRADYMFFSSKAIDESGICYDCYRELITVIRYMMNNASKKVLLLDSQKIGHHSTFKQCTLEDVDICISDVSPEDYYRDRFPWVSFL